MIFNNYYMPRDGDLNVVKRPHNAVEGGPLPYREIDEASIEQPIVPISDMGMSVTEGQRFGTFIQSMQQAIRMGAGKLELSTQMGGGQESVGAEAYGTEARQEIREISQANQVKIHSIHAPSNIGNMSGYNPQERGFNEEYRKMEIEEVKKAIDFASDVTQGASVVVHTGEFMRDMTSPTDARWNKMLPDGTYQFQSYEEEPERQVIYMVDDRTGKLITEVRKSQIIHEPKFKTLPNPAQGGREQWVDENGRFLNEQDPEDLFKRVPIWDPSRTKFESNRLTWKNFEKRAADWNRWNPKMKKDPVTQKEYVEEWTPEEVFFKSQMDTRILQARGSSLYHARDYDDQLKDLAELQKALSFFKSIEKDVPKDEQWKMMESMSKLKTYHARGGGSEKFTGTDQKLPSQILEESIRSVKLQMKYTHEASAAADAQADETYEMEQHVMPISKYAKDQTTKSYAEMGIYAMDKTAQRKLPEPVFVAPENIFPEMGYGSHPEELIELVTTARKRMVEYLTQPYIEDPRMGYEGMEKKVVKNPYYRAMDKSEAEKLAEQHIKATFDTQHLGMWWKNFQPLPGETVDHRKERFDKWYMEQVEKLEKSGIIGNIHVVDGMGGGHTHLPAGQGVMPVVEAVKYLKSKGFKGSMSSEGFGESQMGADRQLTQTWRAFGNRLHSNYFNTATAGFEGFGAPVRWTDVHGSYFGAGQSPYFIFGNYAPSNDWSMWTQVPLE